MFGKASIVSSKVISVFFDVFGAVGFFAVFFFRKGRGFCTGRITCGMDDMFTVCFV